VFIFRFKLLQLDLSLAANVFRTIKRLPFHLHLICSAKLAVNTGIGANFRWNIVYADALPQPS
jgi:hypothetical protein